MRLITILLLITTASTLNARKDSVDKSLSSVDIYYGTHPFLGNFYNQFNSVTQFDFSSPIKTIGIGTSGYFVVTRDGDFNGHFIYHHIIPEAITVQDTLKAKITGFIFSFAYGTAFTEKRRNIAIYMYLGINTGRMRITENDLIRQKNPFFAPKIGLQPKIKLGKLALTMIFEYHYDISKTSWRRTLIANQNQKNISKFKQTAFLGQIGIGYLF